MREKKKGEKIKCKFLARFSHTHSGSGRKERRGKRDEAVGRSIHEEEEEEEGVHHLFSFAA